MADYSYIILALLCEKQKAQRINYKIYARTHTLALWRDRYSIIRISWLSDKILKMRFSFSIIMTGSLAVFMSIIYIWHVVDAFIFMCCVFISFEEEEVESDSEHSTLHLYTSINLWYAFSLPMCVLSTCEVHKSHAFNVCVCVCVRAQLHLKGIIVQCTHENSNNKKRKRKLKQKKNINCSKETTSVERKEEHFTAFKSYAVHLFTYRGY